jgi:hypothetical protein
MIAVALALSLCHEQPDRTPAIYRCPAAEAESKFFEPLVNDYGFDTYCIEPSPGKSAREVAALGKVTFIKASVIDTKVNLAWRNVTMNFVNGKISPKAWLEKCTGLHATVHFLSNPATPPLRESTGRQTRRAVMAEMLLLSLPGKPCLTADDLGKTRYLPGPGELESWILGMNDYLGPMLYLRSQYPFIVKGKPIVIRADSKPGLLIFKYASGTKWKTFFFNNSTDAMDLGALETSTMGINIGLYLEENKTQLLDHGFLFTSSSD